jgi:glycosyltransferase involved in cell wall biosynthesis
MAAYNSEATLRNAVRSVLTQSFSELELVIIDDASRHPAAEVVADLTDARIRVLRHERNRGLPAARNTGLAAARAPLVAQLDADDLWQRRYLDAIVPCFEDPAVGLAYSNALLVHEGTLGDETYIREARGHPIDRFPAIARECPIPAPAVTMRTEAVRAVAGYAEWLWASEDYHLYLKLAHAGWRFAYVDEVLASYAVRPGSMSSQQTRMALDLLRMWTGFTLRHPLTPGAARQWRTMMWRALRRAPRALPSLLRRG